MNKAITTFFFILWAMLAYGLKDNSDSLRFEILLNGKLLKDIHLDEKFTSVLSISNDKSILLSTTDKFYLLKKDTIIPLGQNITGEIFSCAFTSEGILMTVKDDDLCFFDTAGNLAKLYKLPNKGMGISSGKEVMYIYDRNKDQQNNGLYVLAKHGKCTKLFDVPKPINSVVEKNNAILFAAGCAIFSFDQEINKLKPIIALPKDKEIISITVYFSTNWIYFSTDSAIYAVKDSNALKITDELGGVLKYSNNRLIVFNPEKKLLIGIYGLESKIASIKPPAKNASTILQPSQPLTNASIINMANQNLSDDTIISIIKKSEVDFILNVDATIYLSENKVSSPVIMEMKNAMKRKTGTGSNGKAGEAGKK